MCVCGEGEGGVTRLAMLILLLLLVLSVLQSFDYTRKVVITMGQCVGSILQKFSITKSPHADGEGLNAEHNNISKLAYACYCIPAVFLLDRNLNNTHYNAPVKA